MTRNQKIALGCGGAGCLGLIVVGVVGCLIWYFYYRASAEYDRYANINFNSNRTANLNSSANDNSDDSSSRSSSADSSMSNDDKHKLFQAAAMTGDTELQRRVWVKIGIVEDDYTPGPKYEEFVGEHVAWSVRNYQWVSSMNSPEKGRAYVNEHLD
ncbi:MAG TPA: hypothetical protein VFI57_03515 [Pyrinomonadaceae bacterium]|nr:hypothetical protein [Pyrinomonadaceae bacterium]